MSGLWSVLLVLLWSVRGVRADTECLMFEWTAEEGDAQKGLYIAATRSSDQQVGHFENKTNANECFDECCERGVLHGDCNSASFYEDANGVKQCYLLNCVPFIDCQWSRSTNAEWKGGYMYLSNASTEEELQAEEQEVIAKLQWNITGEGLNAHPGASTPAGPDFSTTSEPEVTTAAAAAAAAAAGISEEITTKRPLSTAQPADKNYGGDQDSNQIPWPTQTGGANAGATAAEDQTADTGDLVQGEGVPAGSFDDARTGSEDELGSRVNVPVVIVCAFAGTALLVIILVVAIKRFQAERDRSIYRPLMDDINRGYKESDPLH